MLIVVWASRRVGADASGRRENKNITLAYLCIAISVTEEHNKSIENVKSDMQTIDLHLLQ